MNWRFGGALGAVLLSLAMASSAQAALVFVGSWQVDQGPAWTSTPAIYSGQDAAALLFGGSPSDYAISTVDNNPANVNHKAWYSAIFSGDELIAPILPSGYGIFPAGSILPENAYLDMGVAGVYESLGDYSAFVSDWAVGPMFTNYAFRIESDGVTVPEPATLAMWSLGIVGLGIYRRRVRSA